MQEPVTGHRTRGARVQEHSMFQGTARGAGGSRLVGCHIVWGHHKVQGATHKVQGTTHTVQGTTHKVQGTTHKVQGTSQGADLEGVVLHADHFDRIGARVRVRGGISVHRPTVQ